MNIRFTKKTKLVMLCIIGIGFFFVWIYLPCTTILFRLPYRKRPDSFPGIVWPQNKIGFGCYYLTLWRQHPAIDRGVGVSINGSSMFDIDFPLDPTQVTDWDPYIEKELKYPLESRVYLYMDGRQISDSGKYLDSGGEAGVFFDRYSGLKEFYDISWSPQLSFGKHKAKVVIETLSGKDFEYEWEFTVTFR